MPLPPYLQVVEHFQTLIDDGDITPGERLPPLTVVAAERGISTGTVGKAYETLKAQGYVTTTYEGTFARKGLRTGEDPKRRQQLEDVLASWESDGFIGQAWTVRWDGGDGAYRVTFMLFSTWGPAPRYHDFSEAEFCTYVTAVAEWMPDEAGEAAVALAELEEEET